MPPEVISAVESPATTPEIALGESPSQLAVDVVEVLGLPLARVDYVRTLELIEQLVAAGRPGFFITANLNYAMLSARDPRLRAANRRAAFLVADGFPLVWLARCKGRPLPQRVTGADLVHCLFRRAAECGWRVFLLGGAEGVAEQTARHFLRQYPTLQVVGVEAPLLDAITPVQHEALLARICAAAPDLLLVALGQPKGELWLAEHCDRLGVPVCVQLGASFDFVVGRVRRAPRWIQAIGCEWLFRMIGQPRRLVPRYWRNGVFLLRSVWGELFRRGGDK